MTDLVLIVATGPSVEGVEIPAMPNVHVIAVNDAITWLPHADSFFSMDTTGRIPALLAERRSGVQYYWAIPDGYTIAPHHQGVVCLRRVMGDGIRGICHGLAEKPGEVHAGNSAYGALNLAYHWRPQKIAMLGVDATDLGHAYASYDPASSLSHLPELFDSACAQLKDIRIVNGSPKSNVTCFPRMTPDAAIKWLMRG